LQANEKLDPQIAPKCFCRTRSPTLAIKPFYHYDQVIKQQGPIVAGTQRQFNQGTTALACGRLGMRASSSQIQISRQSLHMLVLLPQQADPVSGHGAQILMIQVNNSAHSIKQLLRHDSNSTKIMHITPSKQLDMNRKSARLLVGKRGDIRQKCCVSRN
jgi:hypothetical protein